MSRMSIAPVPASVLVAVMLMVVVPGSGSASKPQSTTAGFATFLDLAGDAIRSDGYGPYAGFFDGSGNFSFSTGTQRDVSFEFGPALRLLGGQSAPQGATVPSNGLKDDVTFDVLAQAGGTSLLAIQPGAPVSRSVRFQWPNKDSGTPVSYGVHFRGNALFDDDGDGVPNEPYPQDGTEMSKMLTSCEATESGRCVQWTMTPCAGDCAGPDANPDSPGPIAPITQLYGTFSKPVGTRAFARFEMRWGMKICRATLTHPCP